MQTVLDAKAAKQHANLPALQKARLVDLGVRLEADPYLGQQLVKSRIPKSFGPLYNLWRLPLPEGWRALYTVETMAGGATRAVLLWIGTHTDYNRLLGYA